MSTTDECSVIELGTISLRKYAWTARGFAAAKAARRVVGLAKASDIETLDEQPARRGSTWGPQDGQVDGYDPAQLV